MPPCASGTEIAVRPWSAILARRSAERPVSVSQISRSISGDASTIRNLWTGSRKGSCCSSKMKSMSGPRQAEHALRDDVLLDLVGAGVNRPGEREQVTVQPVIDVAAIG